jgi:hypothetical protein
VGAFFLCPERIGEIARGVDHPENNNGITLDPIDNDKSSLECYGAQGRPEVEARCSPVWEVAELIDKRFDSRGITQRSLGISAVSNPVVVK